MPSLTTRASAQQQNAGLPDIQTTGDGVDMCLDSVTGQGNSEYHSSPTMTGHPILHFLMRSSQRDFILQKCFSIAVPFI